MVLLLEPPVIRMFEVCWLMRELACLLVGVVMLAGPEDLHPLHRVEQEVGRVGGHHREAHPDAVQGRSQFEVPICCLLPLIPNSDSCISAFLMV